MDRTHKNTRRRGGFAAAGAFAIAASLGLTVVAVATPSTGTVTPVIIGVGSRPAAMRFNAPGGTNTIVADFTVGPNSSTGWHSHPGKTLVTVQSGTFKVYHADDCRARTYHPGDAFVELPSSVHVGRNETSGTVKLGVVFFNVPIGGSPRIDQPQPNGCDVT
ncbi:MAG: cupin domain-containing protein [Actinomycetota bacterium]